MIFKEPSNCQFALPLVLHRSFMPQAYCDEVTASAAMSMTATSVSSQKAGEHLQKDISEFLVKTLKLQVNAHKSAVAQPWNRKFFSYSFTWHKVARLRIAPAKVGRLKEKIRSMTTETRSKSVSTAIN